MDQEFERMTVKRQDGRWALANNDGASNLEQMEKLPGVLERCNAITEDFIARLSPTEIALGDYSPGRYAWEFSGLHPIDPIPASGKQGLWNWEGYR